MNLMPLTLLAIKQAWRHPLRSGLTVLGVAAGMFLYTGVESLQRSVAAATDEAANAGRLIVYRENRFCPFTSRLPEYYGDRIAEIDGVRSVTPIKVVVNNCRTSLDVVTFRGIPGDEFDEQIAPRVQLLDGSVDAWHQRSDAALVGDVLAERRRLRVGDRFDAAGVTAEVAGIIASQRPEDRNVAYVDLAFLQQAARGGLGVVTQFTVEVDDPNRQTAVAEAIDAAFAEAEEPTHTRPQQAFIAEIAKHIVELVAFTRWVGLGAVVAVTALIANTVLLAVRSRVKEIAVLGTLGFNDARVAWLVLVEGAVLGAAGGLLGAGGTWAGLSLIAPSLSSEGLSLIIEADPLLVLQAIGIALLLGVAAGLLPAWQAARQPIVVSLRSL